MKEIATYVEMTVRDQLNPGISGARPGPGTHDRDSPLVIELQTKIGAPYGWGSASRTKEEWTTWFAQHHTQTFWLLSFQREPAGMVSYDLHPGGDVEIETFGLLPEFVGKGHGYALTLRI